MNRTIGRWSEISESITPESMLAFSMFVMKLSMMVLLRFVTLVKILIGEKWEKRRKNEVCL